MVERDEERVTLEPHGDPVVSERPQSFTQNVFQFSFPLLARVHKLGQHAAIMLPDGRRASMFEGDEILVAYGNRYAPDQFEGEVPDNLGPTNSFSSRQRIRI